MEWSLLRGVPETERQRFLAAACRCQFLGGQVVFHQGDRGDALHLIRHGCVAVRVATPAGNVATLALLGPGDFFGEQALVSGCRMRTSTTVALEPVETLVVPCGVVNQLRRTQPSVDHCLVELLAAEVRRLRHCLLEALFLPVDKRLARRLVVLAQQYGAPAGDPVGLSIKAEDQSPRAAARDRDDLIVIPLTQEDLASCAGTTRPTVSRVLQDMRHQGAVRLHRGRIEIVDLVAIRRWAV